MSYSSTILADNPQAYYHLNESSGLTAFDATANHYDATLSGGASRGVASLVSSQPSDTATLFSGLAGAINLPAALSLDIGSWTSISVEFWIQTTGSAQYIVATCNSTSTTIYLNASVYATTGGDFVGINQVFDLIGTPLSGTLDEVAIYKNIVLTPTQITNHYNAASITLAPLVRVGAKFSIKLAGVDITSHVDEESVQIVDALGQGAGTGGGGVGRAKTATFLTDLGPLSTAVGAGTTPTTPTLVRLGEVQVTDISGSLVFGGFATSYKDLTERTTILTEVDCIDYWQHLDHTIVNEIYDGQTDIFMVKDLLTKYAPWIKQGKLSGVTTFKFQTKNYRHFTLQQALNDIASVTGFQIWIDTSKYIHYESPTTAQAAPFGLSDQPNFLSTFPCYVTEHTLDDGATINRVFFYGGKTPSGDITQNISNQAVNGNKIFTLAYYPHSASDGKIHVNINGGADLVLGFGFGPDKKNTLKSNGGTCDVLLDASSSTLTFDVAHDGQQVTVTYRYQNPLVVVITDEPSRQFYGGYLDGVIVDSSIFDKQQAIQRCRVLLLEQKRGLATIKISCWNSGVRAGQIMHVTHNTRQINAPFIVQQVTYVPMGGGSFRYDLELGSWNWNVIDALLKATRTANPQDNVVDDVTLQLDVNQSQLAHTHALTVSTTTTAPPYVVGTARIGYSHL